MSRRRSPPSWAAKAFRCAPAPGACTPPSAATRSSSDWIATEGAPEVVGSHLLVAIGRRPNTDDLGLDRAGVKTNERGYVEVDDELRTSVPGIWALGDCNGRGAFTHTAWNDYEIVAANLLDGDKRRISDRIPAYALYTDPPLGRAGMTETEVRKRGRRALVTRADMADVSRAYEKGETEGFMKILVDAEVQGDPGRVVPRPERRRGDPLRARHDVCQGALHRPAARHAHPSHDRGVDPDDAGRPPGAEGLSISSTRRASMVQFRKVSPM